MIDFDPSYRIHVSAAAAQWEDTRGLTARDIDWFVAVGLAARSKWYAEQRALKEAGLAVDLEYNRRSEALDTLLGMDTSR